MIETLEGFRAAVLLPADLGATMRTGVQHRLEISVAVAGEQDASAADRMFSMLMGDQVEPRREFIEQNAKDVKFLDV